MSVAIRTATRLVDQDDVNVTPGVGVDEYALTYDHGTAKFVLRAPVATAETVDLYVLCGQSNSYGYGGNVSLAPTPPANSLQWTSSGGVAALALTAGTSGGETLGTSCVPQFAVTLNSVNHKRLAFAVGVTVNGASAAAAADDGNGNFDTTGALRATVVSRTLAAISALQAAGYVVNLGGILWSQGEQDAEQIRAGTITAATYKTALQTMIAYYRAQLGSNLPFYIIRTGVRSGVADTGGSAVRAAQEEVAASDLSTIITTRETINYAALGYMTDTVHYNQAGQNLAGCLLARAASGNVENSETYEVTRAAAAAISLTNNTEHTIVSFTLPAGRWLVIGTASHNVTAATVTVLRSYISTVAPGGFAQLDYNIGYWAPQWVLASAQNDTTQVPPQILNLTTATTVYLIVYDTFSAGSMIAWGKMIAVRI